MCEKVQESNWTKCEYNYKDKFYFSLRLTRSVVQKSIIHSLYMNPENFVLIKQTQKVVTVVKAQEKVH